MTMKAFTAASKPSWWRPAWTRALEDSGMVEGRCKDSGLCPQNTVTTLHKTQWLQSFPKIVREYSACHTKTGVESENHPENHIGSPLRLRPCQTLTSGAIQRAFRADAAFLRLDVHGWGSGWKERKPINQINPIHIKFKHTQRTHNDSSRIMLIHQGSEYFCTSCWSVLSRSRGPPGVELSSKHIATALRRDGKLHLHISVGERVGPGTSRNHVLKETGFHGIVVGPGWCMLTWHLCVSLVSFKICWPCRNILLESCVLLCVWGAWGYIVRMNAIHPLSSFHLLSSFSASVRVLFLLFLSLNQTAKAFVEQSFDTSEHLHNSATIFLQQLYMAFANFRLFLLCSFNKVLTPQRQDKGFVHHSVYITVV